MDGTILTYPPPLFKECSLRPNVHSFHRKTREAIEGVLSLRNSKAIVIGDLGVGKTSIINRYCRNVFERDYKPTIGVEFEMKRYEILGQEFQLQLWDTSGEERFKSITRSYYRGANVVLVVFDLTDPITLADVKDWFEEAQSSVSTTSDFFLIGNKKDNCKSHRLEPIRAEAMRIALELKCEYWEVSALSGENVSRLFSRVAAICFDQAVLKECEIWMQKSSKVQLGQGLQMKAPSSHQQPEPSLPTLHLGHCGDKRPVEEQKRKCCS